MAKLYFKRSGTTYSSLLLTSSSGLLVKSGGATLGASATTGSVPILGNYLQYSKGGSTYNVFLNNNYTTWTTLATNPPTGVTFSFLVYAKSIFVAFGNNTSIYTSTTGTGSWTLRANLGDAGPGWLTFFGGRFFAQGYSLDGDGSPFLGGLGTSLDGITWTAGTTGGSPGPIVEFFGLYNYDGTTSYVNAIYSGAGNTGFWKSTDEGVTYTQVSHSIPSASIPNGIFKFAGSYYGILSNNFIKYASNWLSYNGPGGTNPLGGSTFNYYIHNNYYSNEKMLIFPYGTTGTTYYYSSDLVNWTTGTWPNSVYSDSRRFWSANGLTYMSNGGSTTDCYVTVDGISWTLVSMTGGVTPYNAQPRSGQYVASQTRFNPFFTQHQAGQIGNFSGVNKLIMGSVSTTSIYVSDGT